MSTRSTRIRSLLHQLLPNQSLENAMLNKRYHIFVKKAEEILHGEETEVAYPAYYFDYKYKFITPTHSP